MSNTITHVWFGKEVLARLPDNIKSEIEKDKKAFLVGAMGPDFLFTMRELNVKGVAPYANAMQGIWPYETFVSAVDYYKKHPSASVFSYIMGFTCHYVMDVMVHPYINAMCECDKFSKIFKAGEQNTIHTIVESGIDEYLILNKMGYKDVNDYKPAKDLVTSKSTRLLIGGLYETAFNPIYGLTATAKQISIAFELMRLFNVITTDKKGKVRAFFERLEDVFMDGTRKITPFFRPPVKGYDSLDYMNFNRTPWRTVRNKPEIVDYNLLEVIDICFTRAIEKYIPMIYSAMTADGKLDKEDFAINFEGISTEL